MKSFLSKDTETNSREWVVVDVKDQPLGRVAVTLANLLRGKNRRDFAPQSDVGSFVVVVNAEHVKLTGRKDEQKIYAFYSGYRSGLKEVTAAAMRQRHPDRLVRLAVRGMLPKNRLGRRVFKRLKVFAGTEHPHQAQKPKVLTKS